MIGLILMWVLLSAQRITATSPSSAGTEFIIPAFFGSGIVEGDELAEAPALYVSGLDAAARINLTVVAEQDAGGSADTVLRFSVGEGCTVPVGLNCRLSEKALGLQTSALHVESDQPIALRMHQEHSSPSMPTAFQALPTRMLGTDYFVVEPGNADAPTELIITAGGRSTLATVAPTSTVEFEGRSYNKGLTFEVPLRAYQSLILRSDEDLTGTTVTTDHPVSVIVGEYCSPETPADTICRQPHQLLPTSQWGQEFAVTSFTSSADSVYQIFAQTDGTTVRLLDGGSEIATALNRGESSVESARNGNLYVMETDQPVYVLQYSRDGQALVAVPPTSQRVSGTTSLPVIATSRRNPDSTALITVDCASSDGFQLDLEPLPRSKSVVRPSAGGDSCIIRVPIESGSHVLEHESPDVLYSVVVHVTDDALSYAYPVSLHIDGLAPSLPTGPEDSMPVRELGTRPKRRSGVLLSWRKPGSWPGEPLGYRIMIKNARDPSFCKCRNIIIHNPRRTSYWLRNLVRGERYIAGVRPFGSGGSGPVTTQVIRLAV